MPPQPPDDPRLRWFHVIISAYGSWQYGDARGFRTRHHREHIEGDYKNPPPPGKYRWLERKSIKSMKYPPELRKIAGMAIIERIIGLGGYVLVGGMMRKHGHFLAKLPPDEARNWVGLAKKHAWFIGRDNGFKAKLWGKRSKEIPVRSRGHQLKTFGYIKAHAEQGGWIWDFREHLKLQDMFLKEQQLIMEIG